MNQGLTSDREKVFLRSASSKIYCTAFLATAVVLGWMPALQRYYPNGDDYLSKSAYERGFGTLLASRFDGTGIQRLLAYGWIGWLSATAPSVTGSICVGVHLAAVLLFFNVAQILFRNTYLALALSLLWGVYPAGYYAVLWSQGTYLILHFIFVLLAFRVLLYRAKAGSAAPRGVYLLAGALIVISGLIGEYLLFASMLLGLLAWSVWTAPEGAWRVGKIARDPLIWSPILAVAICLLLFAVTKRTGIGSVENGRIGDLNWSNLNPRSLFSVWYYQHRYFFMCQPWFRREAYAVAFRTWTLPMLTAACGALCLSVWLLRQLLWKGPTVTMISNRPANLVGPVLLAMMFAVSAVHMLAGGYTGDSRHNYIPAAIGFLLLGWACARWGRCPRLSRSLLFVGFLALFGISVSTNWLVDGVYRYESRRHQALIQFMLNGNVVGPITIKYDPPIYGAFPLMPKTMSHGLGEPWCFDWALSYRRSKQINTRRLQELSLSDEADVPIVTISGEGRQFSLTLSGPIKLAGVLDP